MRFETNIPLLLRLARAGGRVPAVLLALLALSALLILPRPAWAKSGGASGSAGAKSKAEAPARASGAGQVEFTKVHQLYLNGDFDAAIAILEDYLKENRQYSHDDSVFIYKHLGVMYAAQYETREKGKYYMHKLLTVEPTARIMDMYASDMIYMIFKNIQEEYAQTRMQMAGKDRPARESTGTGAVGSPAGGQRQGSASRMEPAKANGSRKWFWVGLSAATVAAGVGLYVALNHDPETTPDTEINF